MQNGNMAAALAAMNNYSHMQQQQQQSQLPLPLEKPQFDVSFKNFCNKHGIMLDERVLSVDNRPVNLHSLHIYVMQEGGGAMVGFDDLGVGHP